MEKSFLTMRYYETYYYVNIVHNVLSDPFPYIRAGWERRSGQARRERQGRPLD